MRGRNARHIKRPKTNETDLAIRQQAKSFVAMGTGNAKAEKCRALFYQFRRNEEQSSKIGISPQLCLFAIKSKTRNQK
jgi:hypothetical protein